MFGAFLRRSSLTSRLGSRLRPTFVSTSALLAVALGGVAVGAAPAAATPPVVAVAGTGVAGNPTPGRALSSDLNGPNGVAAGETNGHFYIADTLNNLVEKVNASGTLSIVAGKVGSAGSETPGPATSSDLNAPQGVAYNRTTGALYIADTRDDTVDEVLGGTLSIVAGESQQIGTPPAGTSTAADDKLFDPEAVAVDPATGDLYIADTGNNLIEEVTPGGSLSIVAGDLVGDSGESGPPVPGPAVDSGLDGPRGVGFDSVNGDLLIADTFNRVIEAVTPGGTLSIIAGITDQAGRPTDGPATSSLLETPSGVTFDSITGSWYIADFDNSEVESVDSCGDLSTFDTALGEPWGVAVDSRNGNLYIADASRNVIDQQSVPSTAPGQPVITGFTPHSGAVGTPVTIHGSSLGCALAVGFDGTSAVITANTSTTITTSVPAGASSGQLTVTTSQGEVTSAQSFSVT